jgi:hypothetical protein
MAKNFKVADVCALHKLDREMCFYCGRTIEQLGKKQRLKVYRICEPHDGGIDTIARTHVLCTACHEYKMWTRTYFS